MMAIQSDGKIVVAGPLTNIVGQACGNLARINIDGSLDPTSIRTWI
jgi:hypothetical protein